MSPLRIALDYTSAITQSAGVGRYTRSLVGALGAALKPDEEIVLWHSGRDQYVSRLASSGQGNIRLKRIPIPERLLTIGWQRLRLPVPIERFVGDIDVSHATDFVAPPSRAASISTVHDLSYLIVPEMAHPNLRDYLRHAVPRTLRRASYVVAVSETTGCDLIEHYGLEESRVRVIPNGVDSWFRPPDPTAIEHAMTQFGLRPPYFLMVGTVEPRKNHLTLLRAFEILNASHPEATLAIVGKPGWLSDGIVDEIERATMRLPVRYLQYVDDLWLPALYAGSVALVYPSWYEGFGLPVLEAMASGTAAVVSDRGALPEIAGNAALVRPANQPEAIADAMKQLLEDSTLRENAIRAGQDLAGRYSWDTTADAHLQLYRETRGRG